MHRVCVADRQHCGIYRRVTPPTERMRSRATNKKRPFVSSAVNDMVYGFVSHHRRKQHPPPTPTLNPNPAPSHFITAGIMTTYIWRQSFSVIWSFRRVRKDKLEGGALESVVNLLTATSSVNKIVYVAFIYLFFQGRLGIRSQSLWVLQCLFVLCAILLISHQVCKCATCATTWG